MHLARLASAALRTCSIMFSVHCELTFSILCSAARVQGDWQGPADREEPNPGAVPDENFCTRQGRCQEQVLVFSQSAAQAEEGNW